jgi:hypothetical protein
MEKFSFNNDALKYEKIRLNICSIFQKMMNIIKVFNVEGHMQVRY